MADIESLQRAVQLIEEAHQAYHAFGNSCNRNQRDWIRTILSERYKRRTIAFKDIRDVEMAFGELHEFLNTLKNIIPLR